jgi:hypothetical protein
MIQFAVENYDTSARDFWPCILSCDNSIWVDIYAFHSIKLVLSTISVGAANFIHARALFGRTKIIYLIHRIFLRISHQAKTILIGNYKIKSSLSINIDVAQFCFPATYFTKYFATIQYKRKHEPTNGTVN